MSEAEVKVLIQRELPSLLAQDAGIRDFILRTVSEYYTPRDEFNDRFNRVLDDLQRDREEQARKWNEFKDDLQRDREEQARQWDELKDDLQRDRDEQARKWDEQNRKWDEQQKFNQEILQEIKALNRKHDSTIGALGSRWGLNSEASFRNALKGILETSFNVQVENVTLFDSDCFVFKRPDQVELDIIIQNGLLIACEIKSSMSKSDLYTFDRKVEFYENYTRRSVSRKIVVSPMIAPNALAVADGLGIEVYSSIDDVPTTN